MIDFIFNLMVFLVVDFLIFAGLQVCKKCRKFVNHRIFDDTLTTNGQVLTALKKNFSETILKKQHDYAILRMIRNETELLF